MPFHKHRTWVVHPAESVEWLADKLMNHSWCNCQGWSLGGYLFLNDQTSPDGAFEVAIVKPPGEPDGMWWQVESITFGWIQSGPFGETPMLKAERYIREAIEGRYDAPSPEGVAIKIDQPLIESPEQHRERYCQHCA
ncbi:MAG TPA: hypothetical protein VFT74_05625 [Isosphaeraceae bacterium]|nr:hypothetical protein [Isosphaeraceae bacterium]